MLVFFMSQLNLGLFCRAVRSLAELWSPWASAETDSGKPGRGTCCLSKAEIYSAVHSLRGGGSASLFTGTESWVLDFLLGFRVTAALSSSLAAPRWVKLFAKTPFCNTGALGCKSEQVPAGRGSLLQTHGKIVPV